MQVSLEMNPKHWWIEKASVASAPRVICRAHVMFETADANKMEVKKEELFTTLDSAVEWLKKHLDGKWDNT